MQQIYNKRGAAKALNVSIETIDKYRKNGKLPYRLIGSRVVFCESDLNALLEACLIPAMKTPSKREQNEMAKKAAGGVE